ncbi:hypothetical protein B0T42_10165 [Rathayibacter sp. VKM Ac-2630]|nr:hypothetical protein B0T42_10165 [Rathayibacter sp. VKM Ac-2630]
MALPAGVEHVSEPQVVDVRRIPAVDDRAGDTAEGAVASELVEHVLLQLPEDVERAHVRLRRRVQQEPDRRRLRGRSISVKGMSRTSSCHTCSESTISGSPGAPVCVMTTLCGPGARSRKWIGCTEFFVLSVPVRP